MGAVYTNFGIEAAGINIFLCISACFSYFKLYSPVSFALYILIYTGKAILS